MFVQKFGLVWEQYLLTKKYFCLISHFQKFFMICLIYTYIETHKIALSLI